MSAVIAAAVGLVTGILSGCGVGGGSLLMLYLTLVAGIPQYTAAGINLLYFLACAPAALWTHHKNGLIERRIALGCIAAGVPAAAAASLLAAQIDTDWLRRAFGIFLFVIGIRECFARRK